MNDFLKNLLPENFTTYTDIEKESFFNSPTDENITSNFTDVVVKRSNAQAIYKKLYQIERKKLNQSNAHYSLIEPIADYFSKNDAEIFFKSLYEQKDNLVSLIKEDNKDKVLYHASSTPPDKFENKSLNPLPNYDTFFQMKEDLVFASPVVNSLYPLLPPKMNGMSCVLYNGYELAVISKKDEFIKAKQENPYTYIFDLGTLKDTTFEPNVSLSGDLSNEYISRKNVALDKYERIEIKDLLDRGVKVIFPKNEKDFNSLVNEIDALRNRNENPIPYLMDLVQQEKISELTPKDLNAKKQPTITDISIAKFGGQNR